VGAVGGGGAPSPLLEEFDALDGLGHVVTAEAHVAELEGLKDLAVARRVEAFDEGEDAELLRDGLVSGLELECEASDS